MFWKCDENTIFISQPTNCRPTLDHSEIHSKHLIVGAGISLIACRKSHSMKRDHYLWTENGGSIQTAAKFPKLRK